MESNIPDSVVARVLAVAATSLERGGVEATRPEERLRQALKLGLAGDPEVSNLEVEWRPELPLWPPTPNGTLGGFDLTFDVVQFERRRVVCELKWRSHGGLDALDEVMWDLFKLAHARHSLGEVGAALLVYGMPAAGWEGERRFRDLFSTKDSPTKDLIEGNAGVWEWLVRTSSKSRPTCLPETIRTRLVVAQALELSGEVYEIRACAVDGNWDRLIEIGADGLLA